jgi:hypothetical protein
MDMTVSAFLQAGNGLHIYSIGYQGVDDGIIRFAQ